KTAKDKLKKNARYAESLEKQRHKGKLSTSKSAVRKTSVVKPSTTTKKASKKSAKKRK
ncbi:ribonuclease R, partial [Pasteurella multocida 2000]